MAVQLTTGGLAIISPTARLGEAAHEALTSAAGQPALLVAPNHYHWLGIGEWRARYPEARAMASQRAIERLARKTKTALADLTDLRRQLPRHVSIMEPPGTKNVELWLRATESDDTVLWIVGDAWFNFPETPKGAFGLACRLLGVAPNLVIGRTCGWFMLNDKAAYRNWVLDQLEKSPPTRLAMCHGELASGPRMGETLIDLVRRKL